MQFSHFPILRLEEPYGTCSLISTFSFFSDLPTCDDGCVKVDSYSRVKKFVESSGLTPMVHLSPTGRGTSCQFGPATSHLMPGNTVHSDILVDPENEPEAPSIAPEAEDDPEEDGEEAEGEREGGREDEDEDKDGDKNERQEADEGEEVAVAEGEEADEPEDGDDEEPGTATQCRSLISMNSLHLQSPRRQQRQPAHARRGSGSR
ncbi:hypothetical protein BC827DRAFT_219321 [Russula dissimulans]|nr:hypothetical protein BC827DRAFT_219321 [Russula dissimulans]